MELFARDLQVQERLTKQIADWLDENLAAKAVGVVIEADHLCMSLRGVRAAGSRTVTSALHGLLRDDARSRQEFFALAGVTPDPSARPDLQERPMALRQTFVIVGGGLAGATAAQTLREEGFTGRLRLVGAGKRVREATASVEGLSARHRGAETIFVHEQSWYDDHDVELGLGIRATDVDVAAHEIALDTGERIRYDKVLLATGSSPHRLTVPGADLNGVHYLREARDADRLRAALVGGGRRVVIIGGGWIGLEVAAAARGHGNDVTVVESQQTPLRTALGDELGGMFAGLHREHGVDLRLSTSAGTGRLRRPRHRDSDRRGSRRSRRPRRRGRRRPPRCRSGRGGGAEGRQRDRRRPGDA